MAVFYNFIRAMSSRPFEKLYHVKIDEFSKTAEKTPSIFIIDENIFEKNHSFLLMNAFSKVWIAP